MVLDKMPIRIAVIGANGQLGRDVVHAFEANGDHVIPLTHAEIELADLNSVATSLQKFNPDVVVNTAAMHHVENCEREPAKAFAVNGIGTWNLSKVVRDMDKVLVHVSTDYVFDGKKEIPYEETDTPTPLNVYGNTKLAGEYFLLSTAPKHFVLRTSAIYGHNPCRAKGGLNFIELMLKLAQERGKVRVVDNEIVSPTSTAELARQIVALSRSHAYGLYHATAEGSCSWHKFAQEVFQLTNTRVDLQIAGPNEFPAKVPRPKYSVLENCGLKRQGLNIFRPWQEGVREYVSAMARH
jgi:dTDP-4-dehydrorhamnose reductase